MFYVSRRAKKLSNGDMYMGNLKYVHPRIILKDLLTGITVFMIILVQFHMCGNDNDISIVSDFFYCFLTERKRNGIEI